MSQLEDHILSFLKICDSLIMSKIKDRILYALNIYDSSIMSKLVDHGLSTKDRILFENDRIHSVKDSIFYVKDRILNFSGPYTLQPNLRNLEQIYKPMLKISLTPSDGQRMVGPLHGRTRTAVHATDVEPT